MSNLVDELCKELRFERKVRYSYNFNSKQFPFFTKTTRAEFSDGFSPIVGILARNSFGLEINPVFDNHRESVLNQIEFDDKINNFEKVISDLFVPDSEIVRNGKLLLYIEQGENDKELIGKNEIGMFLNQLFDLENLTEWKNFLSQDKAKNLYEEIILDSLGDIPENKTTIRKFRIRRSAYYRELFQEDLSNLLKNKAYFMEHIDIFFSYYYFFYITQEIISFRSIDEVEGNTPLYYAYEKEKISGTRKCVTEGFNLVNAASLSLIIMNYLHDYVNMLIPSDQYFYLPEILCDNFYYHNDLKNNLNEFLKRYALKINKVKQNSDELKFNIYQLQEWLKEEISNEINTRYLKSIEEISKQGFTKPRGRLGKILNFSDDLILLFIAVIVGKQRTLINIVFEKLEDRGFYFDRITKREVVGMLERMDLLEKMSDSGDAQYVKPIL